jgi:hypothetical protein
MRSRRRRKCAGDAVVPVPWCTDLRCCSSMTPRVALARETLLYELEDIGRAVSATTTLMDNRDLPAWIRLY